MLYRTILKDLDLWAAKPNRKPLVLRGARQVGKTYAVKEFAKKFDTFLYINFEKPTNRAVFDNFISLDDTLLKLFALHSIEEKQGRTLIFFDEIQYCGEAIRQLRYFYEERPELYVIAAGSLLETLLNVKISFPVGRVEYLAMRPMNFAEYLDAMGKEMIRRLIEENPENSQNLHNSLMADFQTYAVIGGMPEVVAQFANTHNIESLRTTFESLITSYKDDVEKYATNKTQVSILRFLIDNCWLAAAERISLGNFAGSEYKTREMKEAFTTLQKAMLVELVYPNDNTELPLLPQMTHRPKLLTIDIGLTNFVANVQTDIFSNKDLLQAWRGKIAEQIVGQELLALNNHIDVKRYFWSRTKSEAEVDFEHIFHGIVVPIEVKAGHNSHLRSLHEFMDNSKCQIAIRVWSEPFQKDIVTTRNGKEFLLLSIPFYLVSFINQILANYISNQFATTK